MVENRIIVFLYLSILKIKDKKPSRIATIIKETRNNQMSSVNKKKPQSPIQSIKQSGLFSNTFIATIQKFIFLRRCREVESPWE